MAMVQVNLRMPKVMLWRVDRARGDVSRNLWIRRAVERALGEQPENQYVSVYDHDENAELPPPPERRVSPPKPASPRVPFRRDVKPFQRGDK